MQHAVGVGTDRLCEECVPPFGCPAGRVVREFEVRPTAHPGHDVRVVCKLAPRCRVIAESEEAVIVDVDERGTLFVAPLADSWRETS